MKLIYALCLLVLTSCTKYAEVSRESLGGHIENITMDISHLRELEWLIGKPKEKKVTQSITFIVDMPKLRKKDLDYLTEQKGIDAWIVRLMASRGSQIQDLGSLYTLFKPRSRGRTASAGAASSVTIKIYYAAAYASERFRAFSCPAFGHKKKIEDMSIKGEDESFSIALQGSMPYQEKSQLIELTPSSFNGGHSLLGNYYLEIALYNSVKKTIHSSFKRIPKYVSISEEETVEVPSCAGEHPEYQ